MGVRKWRALERQGDGKKREVGGTNDNLVRYGLRGLKATGKLEHVHEGGSFQGDEHSAGRANRGNGIRGGNNETRNCMVSISSGTTCGGAG